MTEHEQRARDEELVKVSGGGWIDLVVKIIAVCGVIVGSIVLVAMIAMLGAWVGWMHNWWGWFDPPITPSC